MKLFNKNKEEKELDRLEEYLGVKKDPAVVELFVLLIDLVRKDSLAWSYKDYSLYAKLSGEEELHIFYNENTFMPNKSYVRINGIVYHCCIYQYEITRLGLEIKLSQQRQTDNKNKEKLAKATEILRNKLKECPDV